MDAAKLIQVVVLGIVQGIAEFLPISSSGHLVIVNAMLPFDVSSLEENLAMNIALHVGTLGSILYVYRHEIPLMLRDLRLIIGIVIATIPIVIVGLTLKDFLETAFSSPAVAATGLLVTAVLLWLCEWLERDDNSQPLESTPAPALWQAFAIGLFQALAIVPGISRAGSTIAGGVMTGVSRDMAARFSFLIAIPAIAGATLLHTIDILKADSPQPLSPMLLIGAAVSCGVGILALEGLLKIVRQKKLRWFSVYCLCVSLLTWVWILSQR